MGLQPCILVADTRGLAAHCTDTVGKDQFRLRAEKTCHLPPDRFHFPKLLLDLTVRKEAYTSAVPVHAPVKIDAMATAFEVHAERIEKL